VAGRLLTADAMSMQKDIIDKIVSYYGFNPKQSGATIKSFHISYNRKKQLI